MAIYARKVSIMLVQKFSDKDAAGKDIPGTLCDLGVDNLGNGLKCYWKGMVKGSGVNGTGPKIVSFQLLAGPDNKSGGVKWNVLVKFLEKAAKGEIVKDVFVVGEISSFNGNLSVSQIADVKSLDEIKVKFVEVWEGVKKEGGAKMSDEDYLQKVGSELNSADVAKLLSLKTGLSERMAEVAKKGAGLADGNEKTSLKSKYAAMKGVLMMVEKKIEEMGFVEIDPNDIEF